MLLKGSDFKPAPSGSHPAVCVDFIDMGMEKSEWQGKIKMKPKCRVVFEIDALMENGKRYIVSSKFTATLDERGRLLPFLTSWRGKKFTAAEFAGFETESLIDVPALLQIVHAEKNGTVYANVDSIMFPPKGVSRLEASGGYTRVKDRPTDAQGSSGRPPQDDEAPIDDDDVPF